MTQTVNSLRRKIEGANDLKSVVRTMKALAASSIVQYEEAVNALGDYARTVDLALTTFFRSAAYVESDRRASSRIGIIIFATDQGLVGQFNEVLAEFVNTQSCALTGEKVVWTVGERINAYLPDSGITVAGSFSAPSSVAAITPLIGQLLLETEAQHLDYQSSLYLFHNRLQSGSAVSYEPVCQRLLPLDANWRLNFARTVWPTNNLPEIVGAYPATLSALISEYLFVSLYRASAESLAAENASRLTAMQRAEKNIDELLDALGHSFHQLRQRGIDQELFDVIAGYEAMTKTQLR